MLPASFVSCSDEDNSDVALLVKEEEEMPSLLSEEEAVELSSPLGVGDDELASLVEIPELPSPLDVVESNVELEPSFAPSELAVGLVDNAEVPLSFVVVLVTPLSLETSDLLERELVLPTCPLKASSSLHNSHIVTTEDPVLSDCFVLVVSPAVALIAEDASPDNVVELSPSLTVLWLVSVEDIVLALMVSAVVDSELATLTEELLSRLDEDEGVDTLSSFNGLEFA